MARARPEETHTLPSQPSAGGAVSLGADEQMTSLGGSIEQLFAGGGEDAVKGPGQIRRDGQLKQPSAGAANPAPAIASARAIGGAAFAAMERETARARDALTEAPDGADLEALRRAYREKKTRLDEEIERLAAKAAEGARVRRYEVVDNNQGKPRSVATPGSIGQARIPPGKRVDSLNYDIPALLRSSIKLRELGDDET